MKKVIIYIGFVFFFFSCSKFDEINRNPNATDKVTPAMLATGLILNITQSPNAKQFAIPDVLTKTLVWGENNEDYQYNFFSRNTAGYLPGNMDYSILTNVNKMIDLAGENEKNAYKGLGLFVKAYKLFYISLSLGDIPYSEALQGADGNTNPKYDTQKEVMKLVLQDLKMSDESFALAKDFAGDPLFKGKVDLWRRTVNAFRLKVLMHLSKKADDADLKVKQTFSEIVNNSPLLVSNAQNFQLVYSDKVNQTYPFNKLIHKFIEYPMITNFLIDSLKKMNDYRLFYYASPSKYEINVQGKSDEDWSAYLGVDPTLIFGSLKALWSENKFCLLNLRYTDQISGEPLVRIGYAEQNFIISEAIVRGWMTGNAKEYYEAGVKAAMKFVADNTPDLRMFNHNRKITDTYIQDYLTGTYVKFATNKEQQIKQILQQKYFMRFLQNPYEAYYEYRRTGYPVWPINTNTNLNEVKDKIPSRWAYPIIEYNRNDEHVKEAVDRQFGGQDTPNEVMWLLK